MTERRISWEGGQRKYQPRIREVRIHGLYEMKQTLGKPMTVILDEILAVAIGQFYTSPEYQAKLEADWKAEEDANDLPKDYNNDDYEDISNWI